MLKEIHQVIIFTTNMKRSVEFYTVKLGCKLLFESLQWSEVSIGDRKPTIGLHNSKKVDGKNNSTTQVSFLVTNIEKVQKEMKEKGIIFSRELNEIAPGRWIANFLDPDNNELSIYEFKK